jgi:hypothetical protein
MASGRLTRAERRRRLAPVLERLGDAEDDLARRKTWVSVGTAAEVALAGTMFGVAMGEGTHGSVWGATLIVSWTGLMLGVIVGGFVTVVHQREATKLRRLRRLLERELA